MIGNEQLDAIERLHRLREAGALTDAEFAAGKARILDGQTAPRRIAARARAPVASDDHDSAGAGRSTARYWIGGSAAALAVAIGGAWLLFSEPLVPVVKTPTHRTTKARTRPVSDDTPSPLPSDTQSPSPAISAPQPSDHSLSRADDGAERGSRPEEVPSLDGGYVYRLVDRYATSAEVVQIRRADGRIRDVIDGNSVSVIRNGPYRGYLLVSRHKYRGDGSYDPTDLVRPDGKVITTLPECDGDEDGSCSRSWLDAHGWDAS